MHPHGGKLQTVKECWVAEDGDGMMPVEGINQSLQAAECVCQNGLSEETIDLNEDLNHSLGPSGGLNAPETTGGPASAIALR